MDEEFKETLWGEWTLIHWPTEMQSCYLFFLVDFWKSITMIYISCDFFLEIRGFQIVHRSRILFSIFLFLYVAEKCDWGDGILYPCTLAWKSFVKRHRVRMACNFKVYNKKWDLCHLRTPELSFLQGKVMFCFYFLLWYDLNKLINILLRTFHLNFLIFVDL